MTRRKKQSAEQERATLAARSAARDLLRFARALEARGLSAAALGIDEAITECHEQLAEALSAALGDGNPAESLETTGAARALLEQLRAGALESLPREQRAGLLRAIMATEVTDADLQVSSAPSPEVQAELAEARAAASARVRARENGEVRRRRTESLQIHPSAPLAELYQLLPDPWRAAVAGKYTHERVPADALARLVSAPAELAARVAALRPGERAALSAMLDADGVILAKVLEDRFGDSRDDGWDWVTEPPTSVIGRLRARGLCLVGRVALGPNPRSRPRALVVPAELRAPLRRLLAEAQPASSAPAVPLELVAKVMEQDETDLEPSLSEFANQAMRFGRAQPELCTFAAAVAQAVAGDGAGALMYYVERIWAMYEAAYPGAVPRLRSSHIEDARKASEEDLDAVGRMHERLVARRVKSLVAAQPHLYAFIAHALEDDELPLDESERAVVFHACDTAIRAFESVRR